MQRSSLFDQKNRSNSRAKTPQNNNQLNRSKRQTKSLAKPISSPFSNKKIQQKNTLNQTFKLQSIKQFSGNTRNFYLGKGNNHQMVRKILLRRKNWSQTENKQQFIHFKWAQSNWGYRYHMLGKECLCVNHFEYHRQVSNKQRLVKNMINYCEYNKLNAFNYLPLTWVIDLATSQDDMSLHGFLKFYNRNLPANNTQKRMESLVLPKIKNHTGQNNHTTTKRPQGLFYCQYMMTKSFIAQDQSGKSPYLWILKPTFMNRGRGVALFNSLEQFEKLIWKYYHGEDLEDYGNRVFNMDDFVDEEEKKQENNKQKVEEKKVEDKKPQPKVWNQNGGESDSRKNIANGNDDNKKQLQKDNKNQVKKQHNNNNSIAMTNSQTNTNKIYVEQAKLTQTQTSNNNTSLRVLSFVVQKYIESPMLINQRKFDIRVWAMLTHNYEVYFFKQGYLRFSSFKYSTKNHNNPFIHLTNNSVQKHSAEYNEQSGNQISLSEMKNHMPQTSYQKLQSKIRENIWLSLMAARRKINVNGRKQCFEIFGYDFMVDSQFKVWLIEVNTNPAIEDCSTILKAMIPRMLDDAFKLTLDKIFNNKLIENAEQFPVANYKNDENMWELLGDFKQGVNEKTMGRKLTLLRR